MGDSGRDAEARRDGDREPESQPSQATTVAVDGTGRSRGAIASTGAEPARIDRRDDGRQQRDGDADRKDEDDDRWRQRERGRQPERLRGLLDHRLTATVPTITPATAPIVTGTRIWATRMAVTWTGVNPTAFITPMSR